jgi:tRNA G18 (ribose-2'-O)-methylase SpoU
MAAVLRVPFMRATAWPDDLQRVRDAGLTLAAFTPRGGALPIDAFVREYDRRRVALMFGSEGDGLTDAARDHADVHVTIPMANAVDSLNVAVAAGIALSRLSRSSPSSSDPRGD